MVKLNGPTRKCCALYAFVIDTNASFGAEHILWGQRMPITRIKSISKISKTENAI